jgi:hypothetical protein
MEITARQRTIIMLMLPKIDGPFERDELVMQFHQKGSEFVTARLALLGMPLNDRERKLLALQRQLITHAQPLQQQVIDLIATIQPGGHGFGAKKNHPGAKQRHGRSRAT